MENFSSLTFLLRIVIFKLISFWFNKIKSIEMSGIETLTEIFWKRFSKTWCFFILQIK